jgi:hypothetical protein
MPACSFCSDKSTSRGPTMVAHEANMPHAAAASSVLPMHRRVIPPLFVSMPVFPEVDVKRLAHQAGTGLSRLLPDTEIGNRTAGCRNTLHPACNADAPLW